MATSYLSQSSDFGMEDNQLSDSDTSGEDSGFSTSPCDQKATFQVCVDIEVYSENSEEQRIDTAKINGIDSKSSLKSNSLGQSNDSLHSSTSSLGSSTRSLNSSNASSHSSLNSVDLCSPETTAEDGHIQDEGKDGDDSTAQGANEIQTKQVSTILPFGPETLRNKSQTTQKSKKGANIAIALLGLLEFLSGTAVSVLAPFYTTEAQKHGLSVKGSSAVFASVFLLQIISTPIFGRYISTFGSIRLLFLGSLCSGLANIAFGFVQNIPPVEWFFCTSIVLRCVTALGESAMNVAVFPMARSLSSEKYRTTVLSFMETSYGLGTMSGPFLGGLLYEYGGFSLPFLVCGTLLGLIGGLASVLFLLIKADDQEEEKDDIESENGDPSAMQQLRLRKILKMPSVLMPLFVVVLSGMSTQWYQPTLEPYLSKNYNISGFKASLFLIIDGAMYVIVSPFVGLAMDKTVHTRFLLIIGCAIISCSFFLIGPFYLPYGPSLIQIGIGLAVHGIGMAANFIGTLSILNDEMEKINGGSVEKATGMSTCLWITAESIGGFAGSLVGGSSYDIWGWDISCLIIASLHGLGAVLALGYSAVIYGGGLMKIHVSKTSEERKPLIQNHQSKGVPSYNSI